MVGRAYGLIQNFEAQRRDTCIHQLKACHTGRGVLRGYLQEGLQTVSVETMILGQTKYLDEYECYVDMTISKVLATAFYTNLVPSS